MKSNSLIDMYERFKRLPNLFQFILDHVPSEYKNLSKFILNVVPQKLTEFIFNGDNSKDSLCAVDYYMDKLELILRSTTDSASFSDCSFSTSDFQSIINFASRKNVISFTR